MIKIYLSIAISSCSAERSFSGLERIKTRLRSTTGQKRLSNLAILHIESEELNLNHAIDIFGKNRRMDFF